MNIKVRQCIGYALVHITTQRKSERLAYVVVSIVKDASEL